jgi:hypothetical protein
MKQMYKTFLTSFVQVTVQDTFYPIFPVLLAWTGPSYVLQNCVELHVTANWSSIGFIS